VHTEKTAELQSLKDGLAKKDQGKINEARLQLQSSDNREKVIKKSVTDLMSKNDPAADTNDTNYVFLSFVTSYLPVGLIGLLIAIIFLSAMGSMASALNSLASTSTIDIYKRLINNEGNDKTNLSVSRWTTVAWGVFCIVIGVYASKMGNLLEAVNILGSLFYGTILGIFIVAFYMKSIQGKAVFYAALIAEAFIVVAWLTNLTAFLWLNVFGCLLVMIFSFIFQAMLPQTKPVRID
jgi:Na+/proline symporter